MAPFLAMQNKPIPLAGTNTSLGIHREVNQPTAEFAEGIPSTRSESVFVDYKPAFNRLQAVNEANRCLFCTDAPCIQACPTGIDIPQFIRKIATGNLEGSARTIFMSNILGMTCSRVCPVETLCVGACVYNAKDEPPIQIGKLQRYATDAAYQAGTRFFHAGPDSGKKVALIGAGPASLAAAHRLRMEGHAVTVFEQRSVIGGLNTTGIAPHKLRADMSIEEANWVLQIGGIEVKTGITVCKDITLEALEAQFDAVFVGVGLGADTKLGVEGEGSANIHGAVEFIEQFKLGTVDVSQTKHCVVIGGGNTALDAVREARTLGIKKGTLLYRGVESKMTGYVHEWESAKVESVGAEWQAQPVGFEVAEASDPSTTGKVTHIRCLRLDDAKKPIAGSEFLVPADLVLVAIGQSTLGQMLSGLDGIRVEKGRVIADDHGFTGRAKWYVGGDCRNGGKEVVNAVAEGDAAARAMHAAMQAATISGGSNG